MNILCLLDAPLLLVMLFVHNYQSIRASNNSIVSPSLVIMLPSWFLSVPVNYYPHRSPRLVWRQSPLSLSTRRSTMYICLPVPHRFFQPLPQFFSLLLSPSPVASSSSAVSTLADCAFLLDRPNFALGTSVPPQDGYDGPNQNNALLASILLRFTPSR